MLNFFIIIVLIWKANELRSKSQIFILKWKIPIEHLRNNQCLVYSIYVLESHHIIHLISIERNFNMPFCQIDIIMGTSLINLKILHQIFADFLFLRILTLSCILCYPLLMCIFIFSFDKWIINRCKNRKYNIFPLFLKDNPLVQITNIHLPVTARFLIVDYLMHNTLIDYPIIVSHHVMNRRFRVIIFQSKFVMTIIFYWFMFKCLYFVEIDIFGLLMCISIVLSS